MDTHEPNRIGIDPQVLSDLDAVMKRIVDGTPVDEETSQWIEERGNKITEEIRRLHGEFGEDRLNRLLRDVRDES
jgi:hypothetical protein